MINLTTAFYLHPGIELRASERKAGLKGVVPKRILKRLKNGSSAGLIRPDKTELAQLVALSRRINFPPSHLENEKVELILEAEGIDPYELMRPLVIQAKNRRGLYYDGHFTEDNISDELYEAALKTGGRAHIPRGDIERMIDLGTGAKKAAAGMAEDYYQRAISKVQEMLKAMFGVNCTDLSEGKDFLLPLIPDMSAAEEFQLDKELGCSQVKLALFRSFQLYLLYGGNLVRSLAFNHRTHNSPVSLLETLGFKSKEDFLDDLGDAKALDLGSAHAILAANAAALGSHASIYSLNPFYEWHRYLETIHEIEDEEPSLSAKKQFLKASDIWAKVKELFIAQDWKEKLPFEDGELRRVYSSNAFPRHARTSSEIKKVLREIYRVLESGGEARLGPVYKSRGSKEMMFSRLIPRTLEAFTKLATSNLGGGNAFELKETIYVGKDPDGDEIFTLILKKP